jgi:type I restriction enzyme S subunit
LFLHLPTGFRDVCTAHLISTRTVTKRCKPEKGDVLYSKNGTIGIARQVTWDDDFATFVSLALLKLKTNLVSSIYLTFFLNTSAALRQAIGRSKTGTVTNLHLEEIREIMIPLPPLPLQQKFAALVEKVEAIRGKQCESQEELDQLFNSLMQKAFNGQLVVD